MPLRPRSPLTRAALLAVSAVLLAAGCTRPGDGAGASPDPAPTASPSSVADRSPAGVATPSYTTTGCEEPPPEFGLLCEVTELIRSSYVEPPPVTALAEAAADGLEPVDGSPSVEGFACAVPAVDFRVLCDALARAGGPTEAAIESAVEAMVRGALDPNSAYQDPLDHERAQEDQSGQVEGIGALVTTEDRSAEDPAGTRCPELSGTCRLVIVAVFEDAPADRAGLEAGDLIVRVDGDGVAGRTIDDVVDQVRGPAGTEVELGVRRGGVDRTVVITRAAVDIPVIESASVDGVAYVRLTLFTSDADERFEATLRDLLRGQPERLVLDLRSNPGGTLDTAVEIASEFLPEGLVLRTESPEDGREYRVRTGGLATDPTLEVVVLVDRGSASASEVVAAALEEAGRATLVGQRTFGKDTVQQTFPLDHGGAVKLTIARWVTPDGDGFGGGIEPDVRLSVPVDAGPEEIVARVGDALAW